MIGSYAGAMGQPQFMPTNFFKLAVDFEGDGRRDIWDSKPDALASIANYLARSGWRDGEGWGEQVRPSGRVRRRARRAGQSAAAGRMGTARRRALRRAGAAAYRGTGRAGAAGRGGRRIVLVYGNFAAIRRYNPSDYYALSVGLLGDLVVA